MMGKAVMMVLHSLLISLVAYAVMVYALGQKQVVAESRSVLLYGILIVYMVMFGHGMPKAINKDLF
jgi:hypothetical protein